MARASVGKALAAALVLAAVAGPVAAQERGTVRGTVVDGTTGQPLAGAQVTVQGSNMGSVTNEQGEYVISNVPAGRQEIRVVYIGHSPAAQTVDVPPGAAAVADFQMSVSVIEMDEIIATGYAEQSRRQVSAAVSSLESRDLENNTLASLDAALQGKATGVHVIQNAGNPGNGITVRVRGSTSITASNQPLYVVDGVPIFREDFGQLGLGGQDLSAITGLNANEIESIDILKDASAAAIYGSRGSNGVVMITTKRGELGAPRISFDLSWGTQEVAKELDLLNTQEWIDYFSAAMRFDGYTEDEIQEELDGLGIDPTVRTDWQDEVLRSAPVADAQLSVSGGTDRFRYYLTGGYFDQKGIVMGSRYDRVTGRVNLDFQATDALNVAASLSLAQEDNDRIESDNSIESTVTNAIANEPWAPIYDEDGGYSGTASYANPVGIGLENDVEARTLRSFGTLSATYTFLPWLRATGRAGFDVLDLREYEYQSPLIPLTTAAGVDGVAQIGNSQGRKVLLEGFATAERFIGRSDVSATLGTSVEHNDRELSFVRGEGFTSPELRWPANAARITDHDGTAWEHNLISYFGRATWTYDNRYTLSGSVRRDGSSRFGENEKYGVFPAVSAAWSISEEPFMAGSELFSDLKLRASWGETGNEEIGDFEYLGTFGSANYGEDPGTSPSNLPNPDLRWETTKEWNVGLDVGVLDDRLGLVAEIYRKSTEDLLLDRPVTATSGFTSVLANVGEIENEGWELSVRSVNFRSGGLEWTSEFHVTHNENRVKRLYSPDPDVPGEPFTEGFYNRVEEGEPLGVFYLYRFEGVDPETGDALYTDLDEDGNRVGTTTAPSSEDRMIVGSPHPDYFGGFRNELRWRGFDLLAFLEYSQGAEIVNAMREFADDGGYFYDNKFRDVLDYWTPENPDAPNPRPSYLGESGARLQSSRWVEDASYVRIAEITLGYRVPETLAQRAGASDLRLYVSGRNLHTWTDYSGFAPDLNSFGSGGTSASLGTDFYAYPLARTFTFGVRGTW